AATKPTASWLDTATGATPLPSGHILNSVNWPPHSRAATPWPSSWTRVANQVTGRETNHISELPARPVARTRCTINARPMAAQNTVAPANGLGGAFLDVGGPPSMTSDVARRR